MRQHGLEWMSGAEVESDERELPLDDGTDPDQLESDHVASGFRLLGAGELQTPGRLLKGIC